MRRTQPSLTATLEMAGSPADLIVIQVMDNPLEIRNNNDSLTVNMEMDTEHHGKYECIKQVKLDVMPSELYSK